MRRLFNELIGDIYYVCAGVACALVISYLLSFCIY